MQRRRWDIANIATDWGDAIHDARNRDLLTIHFSDRVESRICNGECNEDCFSVIGQATTECQLKMKEAMDIKWIRPKLNKQANHYTLSLYPVHSRYYIARLFFLER